MKRSIKCLFLYSLSFTIILSCKNDHNENHQKKTNSKSTTSSSSVELFKEVPSNISNILFENRIFENAQFNYFSYEYIYNGGGVAVGDINNDGLEDLFFTANMGFDRLYLNKGNFVFEDITEKSGITNTQSWSTGVTMADVNNDGFVDIYVCKSGDFVSDDQRENLLYLNNGDSTFSEKGKEFGVNSNFYSTQACFFDADNDGDLDLYLGNHPVNFKEVFGRMVEYSKNPPTKIHDQYFENVGTKFLDKSSKAGIKHYGFTLGITSIDFDKDGLQDIYVSNDYWSPDAYFHNNGDGTFSNLILSNLSHTSTFSMGVDVGDINHDGYQDLFAVEMLGKNNKSRKTNMASMNPELFNVIEQGGFGRQFMYNSLQLNLGKLGVKKGSNFSEISYLSGLNATDWSWCPLFADFDNDSNLDLYVTNGYHLDVLNKDFTKKGYLDKYRSGQISYDQIMQKVPRSKTPNYIFKGDGKYGFEEKTYNWGLSKAFNANGAAYADFDNDGDLDLAINALDGQAVMYKNQLKELGQKSNYIDIELSRKNNATTIGTEVVLTMGDKKVSQVVKSLSGYQSNSSRRVHFGLGDISEVDRIEIIWPGAKKITTLNDVQVNSIVEANDFKHTSYSSQSYQKLVSYDKMRIEFSHKENDFNDYDLQVLLPQKYSRMGPALEVFDANGDGLDDIFVGGAKGQKSELFIQNKNQKFSRSTGFSGNKASEDVFAIAKDVNQDSHMDLIVLSGSYEFKSGNKSLGPRIYLNNSKGAFNEIKIVGKTNTNSNTASASDIDGDGDLDIFIGGHVVHGSYPRAESSYFLINNTDRFERNDSLISGDLGMLNESIFIDLNNDGKEELIVAGEWNGIRVFEYAQNRFRDVTNEYGLSNQNGWWYDIEIADFDNDGDLDILAGNLGENAKYKVKGGNSFKVYYDDFDQNGKSDIVLSYFENGVEYPVRGKQCSSEQIPEISEKVPSYQLFGESSIQAIYGNDNLAEAELFEANVFSTSLFINKNGKFFSQKLPIETQFGPVKSILSLDLNKDGCKDLIVAGATFDVEVETGRFDGQKGLILLSDCEGSFQAVTTEKSGFISNSEIRNLKEIKVNGETYILASSNNGPLEFFKTH